jgi:hypothetical protein
VKKFAEELLPEEEMIILGDQNSETSMKNTNIHYSISDFMFIYLYVNFNLMLNSFVSILIILLIAKYMNCHVVYVII